MIFNRLFILLFLASPFLVNAQEIKVLDQEGKPVPDAVVYIFGTTPKPDVFITSTKGIVTAPASYPDSAGIVIRHLSFEEYSARVSFSRPVIITLKKKDHALEQVVVTGEIAPRDVNTSVQTITVLSAERINNLSAQNLEQVMSSQLNVRTSQNGPLGSSMSINGLSGQNIKFLVDGVPVTGRLDGNIDPSQLNMNNVERVEIVEGPMSVAYGTDAAGGVINIITRKPGSEKFTGGAGFYYEDNGQYNVDASAGTAFGKSSVLLSAGRNFFDGWSPVDTSRAQDWKPKEQLFGEAKYRLNLKNLLLGYRLSLFDETLTDKGEPRFTPYAIYAFDAYYKTQRMVNEINGAWMIDTDRSLSGTLSRSDYRRIKNTYRKDLVALEEQLVPGLEEQDTTRFVTYAFRTTYNKYKTGAAWNYQGGIDISHETASGSRFTESNESIGDYSLFGSAEYLASQKVTLRPALRMTYNTHFKAPVIPSFSIKYQPIEKLAIRFSYGKGFRAPSVKELYLYFVDVNHNVRGNENLTPEYSDNFFLSTAYEYPIGKTKNIVKLSAFYNKLRDMITLAQPEATSSLYTYINIGTFSTHGGSLDNTLSWKSVTVNAGIAITGRYNLYADSGDFKKYIYSPDAVASVEYNFKKAGIWSGLYVKYIGELPGYRVEDDNTITQFTNESYTFVDASVRKSFLKETLFITGGVRNILDVTEVSAYGQAGAHTSGNNSYMAGTGRSLFFKLQYNFR